MMLETMIEKFRTQLEALSPELQAHLAERQDLSAVEEALDGLLKGLYGDLIQALVQQWLSSPMVQVCAEAVGASRGQRRKEDRPVTVTIRAASVGSAAGAAAPAPKPSPVDRELIKALAAFLDDGQAAWPMPDRHLGFFRAWRRIARHDPALPDRTFMQSLPADPVEALVQLLDGVAEAHVEDRLAAHLLQLPGWSSYVKWRADNPVPGAPIMLADLLAVRLTLSHLFAEEPPKLPAAEALAQAVLDGRAERGILSCGSGVGASIAANKFPGIYAAICHDTYSAHQGVEHDNMNVLTIGARVIGTAVAEELAGAAGRAYRAGGLMVQFLPSSSERQRQAELPPGDVPEGHPAAQAPEGAEDDAWVEARSLVDTIQDHELVDPSVSSERLLFRLFHERGVRVFEARGVREACRCSRERVVDVFYVTDAEDRQVTDAERIALIKDAMAEAYESAEGDLAARLLAALEDPQPQVVQNALIGLSLLQSPDTPRVRRVESNG